MKCECKTIGDVLKVSVNGGLTTSTVEVFRKTIDEKLKTHMRVLIDCTGLTQIDDAGLETLAGVLKEVLEQDGQLKLAGIPPCPWIVFDITKAASVFDIYGTPEEAMASFEDAS